MFLRTYLLMGPRS